MSIISPGRGYNEALDIMNLKELAIHHDEICETLLNYYQQRMKLHIC